MRSYQNFTSFVIWHTVSIPLSSLAGLLSRHNKVLIKEIRWEVCSSVWLFSQFCILFRPHKQSGFMDDVTLGGPKTTISLDVDLFHIEGAKLGLNFKVSNCEVIS